MNVVLPIPDELAVRLGGAEDVSRRALEAFVLAEYGAGRVTAPELQRVLGFAARGELEAFLQAHGVGQGTRGRGTAGKVLAAEFRDFRRGRTLGGLVPRDLIREGLR